MEAEEVVNLLCTYSVEDARNVIPQEVKNDVYFVIPNDADIANRSKKQRSSFSDDCGAWDTSKGATPKTFSIRTEDGKVKLTHKRNGQFCNAKVVKGKKSFIPMEPQPNLDTIVEVSN